MWTKNLPFKTQKKPYPPYQPTMETGRQTHLKQQGQGVIQISTCVLTNSFQKSYKYICIFYHLPSMKMWKLFKFFLEVHRDPFLLQSQCQSCGCPGSLCPRRGTDLVILEYSVLSSKWVNISDLYYANSHWDHILSDDIHVTLDGNSINQNLIYESAI